ncbi:killer cell lectin-like receptor subfamily E member 1 [Tupaia chinensis]|uniref:killer cell lectin-like receptor subfamily E member 1 n=1 Tax=Tupaia chinensis TaxID=246437 RepID=UPI0003C8F926|nr:killer cell lectin-like receptor subfamily E member 1 [Tupaia chinensis]
MTEGPLIYATLKQNSQQKFVTKDNIKNKLSANELLLMKEKQKRHKQKVHRNIAEDITEKGDFSPLPWRLISSVLSVMCLLLMAIAIAVAVLTANSSSNRTSLSSQQKGHCCHPCPKNWVWFQCSCYYFSKEMLTWEDSQRACLSLNSSLLEINKEEANFFSLRSFYWIGGHKRIGNNHLASSSDSSYLPPPQRQNLCPSYGLKGTDLYENCKTKQTYICKNHLIYSVESQE